MNKVIKSMVAIVLAVTMMFSGAVSAFAAESDEAELFATLSKIEEILKEYNVKQNLKELTDEVNAVVKGVKDELNAVSDANINTIKTFIKNNCSGMGADVDKAVEEVNDALDVFKNSLDKPKEILNDVEDMTKDFEGLLNRVSAVKAAYENLNGIIADLEKAIDEENIELANEKLTDLKEAQAALNDIPAIMDDAYGMKDKMDAIVAEVTVAMEDVQEAWNDVVAALNNLVKKVKAVDKGAFNAVINATIEAAANAVIEEGNGKIKDAVSKVENYLQVKLPAVIAKVENIIPEEVKEQLLAALDKADCKSLVVAVKVAELLEKVGDEELPVGVANSIREVLVKIDERYPSVLDAMEDYTPDTVAWLSVHYNADDLPLWPRAKAEEKPEVKVLLGDVTLDGKVNGQDIVLLRDYLMERTELSEEALVNADVTLDSKVNGQDIVLLRDYLMERIAEL